jgi:putative oxidoreductase
MGKIQKICSFLGRLFIGFFFLASAVNKIINWSEAQNKFLNIINDWNAYLIKLESAQTAFNVLIPWITPIMILIIATQIIGGLLLMIGIRIKLGALLIVIFLIPMTIMFNAFWITQSLDKATEIYAFLQNIAIIGGVLHILAFGYD